MDGYAKITHQRAMEVTPDEDTAIVTELTFPGYRDQTTTKLPSRYLDTNKDASKAQQENILRLMDRLAYRHAILTMKWYATSFDDRRQGDE